MQGACAATRDNNFGDNLPDCGGSKGGNVNDLTLATCEAVFADGVPSLCMLLCTWPASALLVSSTSCHT